MRFVVTFFVRMVHMLDATCAKFLLRVGTWCLACGARNFAEGSWQQVVPGKSFFGVSRVAEEARLKKNNVQPITFRFRCLLGMILRTTCAANY